MTPLELCRNAILNVGVASLQDTIYAEDINKAFDVLNSLLAAWSVKDFLLFNLIDVSFVADGSQSYSIGTGQTINTPRPNAIENAYARFLPVSGTNSVDIQLGIIQSRLDYASITLKGLTTFPSAVWMDTSFPYGNVFVYPIPTAGKYEIHLVLKDQLTQFANLTDTFNLPQVYWNALEWNTAFQLFSVYRLPINPLVERMANQSANTVRQMNTQVSFAKLAPGYGRSGRGYGNAMQTFYSGGF